MCKF
ncbi:hypothetical protein D050_4771A, partial [Vibrio parahaemolyticus VPCR-2009]